LPAERVAYLVQEDERQFLPEGDDRVRCQETLALPGLRLIVRRPLLESLQRDGLATASAPFDLAFPPPAWSPRAKPDGGKLDFLLVGDPDGQAGLYWRSLEAVARAMQEGVLDPHAWDFALAASPSEEFALPFGVRPRILGALSPDDYAEQLGRVDLGLGLDGRVYPALGLAASGGVMVSSSAGLEAELAAGNILSVGTSLSEVVDGLRRGAALATSDQRGRNYAGSRFQRDWRTALAPALDQFSRWFDD
jgi:hypothetical protein